MVTHQKCDLTAAGVMSCCSRCVYLALQLALLPQSQVLRCVGHDGERRLGIMSEREKTRLRVGMQPERYYGNSLT